jgi:hypothetical protein
MVIATADHNMASIAIASTIASTTNQVQLPVAVANATLLCTPQPIQLMV